MNLATQFPYVMNNLEYHPAWYYFLGGIIILVILFVTLRELLRFAYGAALIKTDQDAIAKKKSTLNDLILMKDIQTELEKEIEQAMLKATFQG